jgi:hypothetical protein
MSNRWFALWFVWISTTLGWCWRIAEDRDLAVAPLGYVCFLSLALWLWARLERMRKQAALNTGSKPPGAAS